MRARRIIELALLLWLVSWPVVAQTTSGSISGTVLDAQGAAVAGATVTVRSVEQNTSVSTTTDDAGRFVFLQLPPATYTLSVEKSGFMRFEKRGLILNAYTSLSVGNIPLQVGAVAESVEVTAEGLQLQTDTGERSSTIVGTQIENIQVNGRSPLALLSTVPGLHSDLDTQTASNQTGNIYVNGARNTQFNITVNGASNIDTGSNTRMMATLSLDSVQEFKVLTSSYDARYGKAGGAQIIIVSKSGTREFHGSGYWYYRDKGMNANSWINNRDGFPKPDYHFNYFGYNIGGPIYIPGKFNTRKDKLFFFWSEEYQRQLVPQSVRRITVPTLLERQGDFSQSVDNTGSSPRPFPFIKDPLSPLPCNASNTSGCFQDGGVVGRIPANRLYGPGLAVLRLYPEPNISGQPNFNYFSQVSEIYPRHEQLLRVDSNLTERWRLSGSWTHLPQDVERYAYCFINGFSLCPNFPLTPLEYNHPGYIFSVSATATLSPTMTNEVIFDVAHHPVSVLPVDPNALTRATTGINLPTLYPPYADWIPQISFSGGATRIANAPVFNTGGGAFAPFNTFNSTYEWIDNFSKSWNKHLVQAGLYIQRNVKDQTAFVVASGNYNFGNPNSSPFDTGFAFANAAAGVFGSFSQASNYVNGQYRYTNVEMYLQDSWKVTPRVNLNYGVRVYWLQPYYDQALQTSTFAPDRWDPSQAPRLYWPCTNPATGQRAACDPVARGGTGEIRSAVDIGKIVPNSGNLTNGILQAGKDISKYLMKTSGLLFGPRLGLAIDLTGRQNLVFRAGGGIYYDRYQGNIVFNLITNPPTIFTPSIVNDFAQNISLGSALINPSGITAVSYDGKIPTIYNYSAGIQAKLPWATVLDVSYVGSGGRQLLFNRNLNPVPYGATFLKQNQDPTRFAGGVVPDVEPGLAAPFVQAGVKFSGNNALPADFLRPYRGYGNITLQSFGATSNYNALQVKVDRRFAKGLFLNVAYTWGKCLTIASSDGDNARIDNLTRLANYGPCSYDVRQRLSFNYVYAIPKLAPFQGHAITRAIFNDWQISGITVFRNGLPYNVTVGSITGINLNNNVTGSQTQGPRVRLVGDPYLGTTDSPYNRLNPAAFAPPPVGSIGIDAPLNYLNTPGVNNWDMAVQRNVPLREKLRLQLRVDAFNVFNHTQFSSINSTINFSSLTNPTPTNLPYDSNGNLVNKNGFGTVSGVRSPRVLQIVARLVF
jgi:hypothetical protein